jgi:hypothetical protein
MQSQIKRVGAGLGFASGYEFNSTPIGNPGLKLKTWITLDGKRDAFHIVPTVSAFNRNILDAGYFKIHNYLFMADLDGQYMFYRDRTLKIVGFLGVNATYLRSDVRQTDPKYPIPETAPGSTTDMAIGGNAGGGLELRMGAQWDMNVSAKYILSQYSQFIISVEGVYYFQRRRKSRR